MGFQILIMNKIILYFILLLITFSSCEKVIEIKLNESSRQIIIEGLIDDLGNQAMVKINRTVSHKKKK